MSSLLLVDTSVAVALLVEDHIAHQACREAVAGYTLGLAGHATFETMSVLSRLPPPQRRSITTISEALVHSFPHTYYLSADGTRDAASQMAALGIGGGAVYDALVAAATIEAGTPLVTRDRRARATYQAMGAAVITVI